MDTQESKQEINVTPDFVAEDATVNMDEVIAIATDKSNQSVVLFKSGARLAVTEGLKTRLASTLTPM